MAGCEAAARRCRWLGCWRPCWRPAVAAAAGAAGLRRRGRARWATASPRPPCCPRWCPRRPGARPTAGWSWRAARPLLPARRWPVRWWPGPARRPPSRWPRAVGARPWCCCCACRAGAHAGSRRATRCWSCGKAPAGLAARAVAADPAHRGGLEHAWFVLQAAYVPYAMRALGLGAAGVGFTLAAYGAAWWSARCWRRASLAR